jgi:cytochrome c oxidase subunit 2
MRAFFNKALFLLILALTAGPALALPATETVKDNGQIVGAPGDWQLNLPPAESTIKVDVDKFHDLLLVVITVITAFVFLLLAYVCFKFRARPGRVASTRSHHGPLEVIWTVIPVLILLALAFPSLKLLYFMDKSKHPELTVKIAGHQWYWGYEYPELGIDEYASNIIPEKNLQKGQTRLLSVDEPLVVPIDTDVQFLVTGTDVIHSWYVPSIGVNRAAVPGRTNEAWSRFIHEGVVYGQCSKICGLNHGYMPIEVRVVSKDKFKEWAEMAKASGVDKANAAVLGLTTADAAPATTTSLAALP